MMMNDMAIDNIQRILQNEIAEGHAVLGIISVTDEGKHLICWRTDDVDTSNKWQDAFLADAMAGTDFTALVKLPKEA